MRTVCVFTNETDWMMRMDTDADLGNANNIKVITVAVAERWIK